MLQGERGDRSQPDGSRSNQNTLDGRSGGATQQSSSDNRQDTWHKNHPK